MTANDISGSQGRSLSRKRLAFGGAVFAAGQLGILLIPVVAGSGLPNQVKALISGLLLFGVPEISILLTIAILGKTGFQYLKKLIFGYLGRFAPAEVVSDTRYRIGLVLFILPLALGWIAPYGSKIIPGYTTHYLVYSIAGDVILLVSLFILGGEFWEKLHALFRHDAYVMFSEPQAS
jgi:hypothetical protein